MKIAYGDSRTARKWKNNEISWEDFCKRVSTTQYTTETVEEYRKMTKARRDAIKDVGGYVAGHLKDGEAEGRPCYLPFHADSGYGQRDAGDPG